MRLYLAQNFQEVKFMENKNNSIGCTVDSCKYHAKDTNYCTKNVIEVSACNSCAKTVDNTCCQSFEAR